MTANTLERSNLQMLLLKEYAEKIRDLSREFYSLNKRPSDMPAQQIAWLLDRARVLIDHGIELVNSVANSVEYEQEVEIELKLRLDEMETELHHLTNYRYEYLQHLKTIKLYPAIKKLRKASGLNAAKGGPLHPDE